MSRSVLLGATAFIWIFIKLPQEWWIHIAQLDTTDLIQEDIFGVPAGTAWLETFAARPAIVVLAIIAVAVALYAARWLMKNKLPPRDRPLRMDADSEPGREVASDRLEAERQRMARHFLRPGLLEKVVLIALVSIIFGQVLQVHAGPLELSIILGIVVVANAASSIWLERRGFGTGAALAQFVVTGLLNIGIVAVIVVIFEVLGTPVDLTNVGFLVLLVTLLVTLYDRYRPEYLARFTPAETAEA
jgi:hypothetical protein